jgi:hypothetical protein
LKHSASQNRNAPFLYRNITRKSVAALALYHIYQLHSPYNIQGLQFRKNNLAPSEKQEISEISEILRQNQIDLIFLKNKNDIIYIKKCQFRKDIFFGPTEIKEISVRNCKP